MDLIRRLRSLPGGFVGVGVLIGAVLAVGVVVLSAQRATETAEQRFYDSVGNPGGDFPVPPAGRGISVSRPAHVVGNGTPASCTSAEVVRDVAAGGVTTFNCGPKPVTIEMSATARVRSNARLVVLDGGGLVTLSGGGKRRILFSDTCTGAAWGPCTSQAHPRIVVQNITFEDGYDGAHQATCTENVPKCGYGGVDGGGAIYVEGGQLKAVDSRFVNNACYAFGPDLGGGAIRAILQYQNGPVYITHDTFSGGRCSNGGALSSINVKWEVLNSRFSGNKAIGWGANPASPGTPGGGSGGAMYLDGKSDDTLIAGSVMDNNTAREGGGALFDVVDTGLSTVTFDRSELHDNISGKFQTSPGVFYQVDRQDRVAVKIDSTVN